MIQRPVALFSDVRGMSLLIALSGGADSTALTCMLAEARDALGLSLHAVHVHHGLRGADADGDAAFCEALCAKLGIPFGCVRLDLGQCDAGIETAAREARHRELEAAREALGADYIALAHHSRDQAETVLMHMMRGAGLRGLCGMRRISGRLYRPLLDMSPEALREWLTARGQGWREDHTNYIPDNPRNAVRLKLLPQMEGIYPGSERAIVRLADIACEEDRYMQDAAARLLAERCARLPNGFRIESPETAHPAVLRRAFAALLGEGASYDHIAALTALCGVRQGGCPLPDRREAVRTEGALYIVAPDRPRPVPVPYKPEGTMTLEGVGTLRAEQAPPVPVKDDPFTQVLDADKLEGCVLRTRLPGDRMRPLGTGDRKLKEILIDRKVDRPLRDFMPLLAREGRVLWLIGCAIGEEAKITGDTKRAVRLRWERSTVDS
ncbi:MAG: tRNA lysidine(34) synthetase TilS [Clostridiales bacterium]|nr:tRNA lysidine(34) synthetase TilS [Clostridiales bacterium]